MPALSDAVIAGDTTPDVFFTDVINFSDSPADQDGNFPNETGIPGAVLGLGGEGMNSAASEVLHEVEKF